MIMTGNGLVKGRCVVVENGIVIGLSAAQPTDCCEILWDMARHRYVTEKSMDV
jgi:hypothetical protein